jgi:peptidoglycan hydrolase-like protein with peptidoglycan-binding domain
MEVLEAHSDGPSRRIRPWVIVAIAVIIIAVVVALTAGGSGKPPAGHASTGHSGGGSTNKGSGTHSGATLRLSTSNPLAGASNVASDTTISLTFSAPVSLAHGQPTLTPAVQGSWSQTSADTLAYNLSAPLIPQTTYTVTVPDGTSGLRGTDGSKMSKAATVNFSVATGDYSRLQQLLAALDYLPLSFTPSGPAPAPKDMAIAQPGAFNWRWANQPPELMAIWAQGSFDEVTRAAVESFENQNNLTVDGIAGPQVWSTLLADVASQKVNANPYVYVLVNKVQPENLTLWNNGTVEYSNILVNTGAPGADTTDGNYAVFEHVRFSDMKGTNPDGSKYNDPNVPYASYFNGGDALHGFIRAQYGYPQSNGCVEMAYSNAALVWPLTPIGTVVTVEGPATPGPPPTTTTTTTAPPTTTTAPPPPATTAP